MALDLTYDSGGNYLYPDGKVHIHIGSGCMQADPTVPLTGAGI